MTIELAPQEEFRMTAAARLNGLDSLELVKKLVTDYLPPISASSLDAENQALINSAQAHACRAFRVS